MKRNNPTVYVLDTFAVVAYLNNESAAPMVRDLLRNAKRRQAQIWLSIINYGESLYVIERARGLNGAQKAIGVIDQLPIAIAEASRELTFLAAHLKAQHPMSFADSFSAALAKAKNGILLTGDKEFKTIESMVSIQWLPN